MNRKGLGLMILTGVFFFMSMLIITFAFIHVLSKDSIDADDYIGLKQAEILLAGQEAEKTLLYTDQAAGYSAYKALINTAQGSGHFQGSACGEFVYSLWNNATNLCYPNEKQTIEQHFNNELNFYLGTYSGPKHYNNYDLNLQGNLDITGRALRDLTIPIGKTVARPSLQGVLAWPLDAKTITSCYGIREVEGKKNFHDGIDIAAPEGTQVRSAASGVVVSTCSATMCSTAQDSACKSPCGDYGQTIVIKHDNGLFTRYSHLSQVSVKEGDRVTVEQPIGAVGNTGYSLGAHLDFKVFTKETYSVPDSAQSPFCFFDEVHLRTLITKTGETESCVQKYGAPNAITKNDPELARECAAAGFESQVTTTPVPMRGIGTAFIPINRDDLERVDAYTQFIEQVAKETRLDPNLLRAIMLQESRGYPYALSNVGAGGLMQLMPATARDFGLTVPVYEKNSCKGPAYVDPVVSCDFVNDDRFDPSKNLLGGAKNLRRVMNLYDGDVEKALAAYNWGQGNLNEQCCGSTSCNCNKQFSEIPNPPSETRTYVLRVTSFYEQLGGLPPPSKDFGQGTYTINPSFALNIDYDLSVYAQLKTFVTNVLKECDLEVTEDVDACVQQVIAAQDLTIEQGLCTPYAQDFQDYLLEYFRCQNNLQTDCTCLVTRPENLEIVGNQFKKGDDVITFSSHVAITYEEGKITAPQRVNPLEYKYFYKINPQSVAFTKEVQGGLCYTYQQPEAFCAQTENTIPRILDEKLVNEPEQIPFAIMLRDSVPPADVQFEARADLYITNITLLAVPEAAYYKIYTDEGFWGLLEPDDLITIGDLQGEIALGNLLGWTTTQQVIAYKLPRAYEQLLITAVDVHGTEQKGRVYKRVE